MKIQPETAFDDVIQDIPKTEMETTIQEETRDHEIESKIQVSFPPWNLNKYFITDKKHISIHRFGKVQIFCQGNTCLFSKYDNGLLLVFSAMSVRLK